MPNDLNASSMSSLSRLSCCPRVCSTWKIKIRNKIDKKIFIIIGANGLAVAAVPVIEVTSNVE